MVPAPVQIDPALGSVLRGIRQERSQTQEDLAHEAGITVAALARIERGQSNPRWATVRSIAAALNIKLPELGAAVEQAEH
jgi:transcriptional regulator with XRE-family HTH domain